ncbi:MAG: CPBP family intramembrane metalloprotease [Candidatus Hydrogenedentes bacterium]|nr:CPBP family intramembrane metalloprotease [Candidatus Hydrogenedentota bacterium]
MNLAFTLLLAAYVLHSIAMHRQEGPETEPQDTQIHRGLPAPLMPLALFFAWQAFSTPWVMGLLSMPALWTLGGVLVLLTLVSQLKKKKAKVSDGLVARLSYIGGGLLQTALLGLALYLGFLDGVLSRSLFDPKWVILGGVAGHLIFGVSLIFSHRSLDTLRDIAGYVLDPRPLGRFLGESPRQMFACLDVSLIEELIYRVAAQSVLLALTGSPWVAIGVTALVFSVVHRHFFYNHVVDSVEFLAFSLLLGILYQVTGSFMLVVMIHTVRNIEIVYFDHATRPETAAHWRLTPEKA